MTPQGRLSGRVALVTGASRGIGRACALRLAAEGADVAVGYLMNERAARQVAVEVEAAGARAVALQGDVRSTAEVERVVAETAAALGDPDIVVANAALTVLKPVLEIRDSKWDLTLETSARSLLALARASVPGMRRRGAGHIVALSSLGSRRYTPGYAAMAAAKAAAETLVRYLAVELAPDGIRVNCVSGGPIATASLDYVLPDDESRRRVAEGTPLGRLGRPDDLAAVVTFLCTPDAGWITGQTIVADGGLSLR